VNPAANDHEVLNEYGVQRRVPGRAGARNVLGFEAATTLDEVLDEVIAWIDGAIKDGTI
jgi:UDP-glucose 4-epimerase